MPTEQTTSIALKSKELSAVLGSPPRWLIRWGSLHILLLVLLLLVLSAFITYPETIAAGARIITADTGTTVCAKQQSQVVACLVKNNQLVEKDMPLLLVITMAGRYDTLCAPRSGIVLTERLIINNDKLEINDLLFTIVPATSNQSIELVLQPAQSAQLQPGMTVTIELSDYPSENYGILKGRVLTRPQKKDGQDICTAILTAPWPPGLKKAVMHQKTTRGQASIIITEKPFINRLFRY